MKSAPEALRGHRLVPDVHGVVVMPDDGKNLSVSLGQATATTHADAAGFIDALEEALPTTATADSVTTAPIRQAVRLLNLAQMNVDPIPKTVLAVGAVEGLATRQRLPPEQQNLVDCAAAFFEALAHLEHTALRG